MENRKQTESGRQETPAKMVSAVTASLSTVICTVRDGGMTFSLKRKYIKNSCYSVDFTQ